MNLSDILAKGQQSLPIINSSQNRGEAYLDGFLLLGGNLSCQPFYTTYPRSSLKFCRIRKD